MNVERESFESSFFDDLREHHQEIEEACFKLTQLYQKTKTPKWYEAETKLRDHILSQIEAAKSASLALDYDSLGSYLYNLEVFLVNSTNWRKHIVSGALEELFSVLDDCLANCDDPEKINEISFVAKGKLKNNISQYKKSLELERKNQRNRGLVNLKVDAEVLRNKKIYLVEDEYTVLQTYVETFELSDAKEVRGFEDPFKALNELSRGQSPDIFIVDYKLPNMDGLKFSRHARKHIPNAIIIIVSGIIVGSDIKLYQLNTVNAILEKPVTVEDIIAEIGNIAKAKIPNFKK